VTLQQPRTSGFAQAATRYITRRIMPLEALVSLPVPVLRESRPAAAFFATLTLALHDRSNWYVYRPPVRIYVDWESERVEHIMVGEIVPTHEGEPMGLLLPSEFGVRMNEELEERYWQAHGEVYERLEEVGPAYFARNAGLIGGVRLAECERAYRRVVNEQVWSLYEELNPDFFAWLRAAGTGPVPPPPDAGAFCIACGASVAAGVRFCIACGAPVASPPRPVGLCPACNVQNGADSRFCIACGTGLTG